LPDIDQKSDPPSGKTGYYFAENGASSWKSISEKIGEVGKKIGAFEGSEVGSMSLGEAKEEVMQVMDDMRSAGVDFITIGQYLQPTRKHAAIDRFVHPDEFAAYEEIARAKGFLMVAASPLTRSSHHAGEDFARLQAARTAREAAA